MPCRYEESESEKRARLERDFEKTVAPLREKLDALTHENDMLREIVLEHASDYIPLHVLQEISDKQTEHREEDLRRLDEYFAGAIRRFAEKGEMSSARIVALQGFIEKLTKVRAADPKKPLEAQLGFDPDSF